MHEDFIVSAPEISQPKKKIRKRKKKGSTAIGWEKLRERWPAAPESVPGVGLISGESSGIGAAITKATQSVDIGQRFKRRKKRRGTVVMDGEEVATEILNPPPLPAGHTVTAFGGGIIPGITNSYYPIVGKALPRIGRRLVSNAQITGDQNPMTRVDANKNGLIFDGTWREMPDPTPGDSVSGAMGLLDRFRKPDAPQDRLNRTPFGGVDSLIKEQAEQVKKFEAWASRRNWFEFHKEHFDWWTFPIDRGSAAYGFKYDVSGAPLIELRKNKTYLDSLRNAASLYLRSMAWDLKKHDWVDNPDFDRGQDPTAHINQARLFKIGRSMQIHGLNDEFDSVRSMVQSLRQAGYLVGNENFWDDPNKYHMHSQFIRGNNISGAMSIGIGPKKFDGYDGGEQRDPRKEPQFIAKWAKIDLANSKYFEQMKKGSASKPETVILFDWKDDSTRLDYITNFERGKLRPEFAKYGNAGKGAKTRMGLGETLNENIALLKNLGLIWGTQGSTHGALYSPFGIFLTHSSSPKNEKTADGEQVRDILGLLDKTLNPSQYWDYFENWIRNPYATMRDKRTGKDVGVRLYFNNDYEKMVAEFDRRIKELKDAIYAKFGKSAMLSQSSQIDESIVDHSSLRPHVIENILRNIDEDKSIRKFSAVDSIKHMADKMNEALIAKNIRDGISPAQLESLLKAERKNWLEQQLRKKPTFLKSGKYDELTASQYKDAKDLMKLVHAEAKSKGIRPEILDVSKIKKEFFPEEYFTQPIIQRLHEDELSTDSIRGAMSIGSSHIKTVEAQNTSADKRHPRAFINHVTSTPSAYLSLPKPTEDLDEAQRTGKPISWLIPGQMHPLLEERYNAALEEIKALGVTDAISHEIPPYTEQLSSKVTAAERQRQDKLVNDYQNIKFRHAMILQMVLGSLGVTDREANRQIAYGLLMRASVDAARANYLEKQFDDTDMTPDSLETLKDSTESVFDNIDFMQPEKVNVTVPAPTLAKIFNDGRLKTQHETNTSQGAYNPDLRAIQEVAMFSIHPKAKQRPIYGTVRRGTNEDSDELSTQYGAATIVLKDGVENRTTWTQADSLGHQTAASTLMPNKRTWDGLHSQTVHPKTQNAYFSGERRLRARELGLPTDYENWPFIEAQIHGGVTLEDISHIIIDEDWYENNPEMLFEHFGPGVDVDNWMESPTWIQISKVAESLDIPIVMLRKGLAESDVLEEPE